MLTTLAILAAIGVIAGLGEWLQVRRIRRLGRLSFGPASAPRSWVRAVPWLRMGGVLSLTWGLWQLATLPPRAHRSSQLPEGGYRHILLVLDVSPSMQLKDAGPGGDQTRMKRASDVLLSVFERVALDQVRISVVAFYNGAKPVVIDTFDLEVVRNILNDLPLDQAFELGKTKILDGLQMAAEIAKPWQPQSTALVLVTDGDTVPDSGMPEMPKAIAQSLVIGVGDAKSGKFIDGHQSRQDASTLRQIAGRLRGVYHDANVSHLPSEPLKMLARVAPLVDTTAKGIREAALAAVAAGAGILALVPVALARFGSAWPGPAALGPPPSSRRFRSTSVAPAITQAKRTPSRQALSSEP